MAEVRVEHTESTVSSVRSTVSTASSGYAIVSVPGRQRGDIRSVYPKYPPEPPPDYDDEMPTKEELHLQAPRPTDSRMSSPKKENESKMPLLSKEPVQTDTPQKTIVRINSRSQDINIEIVSNPAQSPASTTADSSFLYNTSQEDRFKDKKCCKLTLREKALLGGFVAVLVILLIVILNFTTCIGGFTSACD